MIEPVVCAEKHKRIDEKLREHEDQLEDHNKRIGDLEKYQSRAEQQVSQLCQQIKALVKTLWWGIGLAASSLVGFFFWYIQSLRG